MVFVTALIAPWLLLDLLVGLGVVGGEECVGSGAHLGRHRFACGWWRLVGCCACHWVSDVVQIAIALCLAVETELLVFGARSSAAFGGVKHLGAP